MRMRHAVISGFSGSTNFFQNYLTNGTSFGGGSGGGGGGGGG